MTTNAELADELERLSRHQQDCIARWNDVAGGQATSSLARLVTDNLPAILTALRASRPEPAADAVEAVARPEADEGAVAVERTIDGDALCEDCPRPGYPTDETRCWACPRRAALAAAQEGS